jgi:cob(I)alamin adenosyltransferase
MPVKGLIMIHTGNGKGKTTAALGTAFRALGYGWKILVVQFIKGSWHYGEIDSAKKFGDLFQILPMGEGFTWDTQNPERDRQKAQEAWAFGVKEALTGKYRMIIFDEINYVIRYNYLEVEKVVAFLKTKPPALHVFLTGRDAHEQLIEIADLVTEMREIKHPFKKGIKAQKGIEF